MAWIELSTIWAALIAFGVLAYVVLDGFDLGVGILFPAAGSSRERALMMDSVVPVWDGNETWIVLGGGGLFAVFPLAYSVVMPALYIPIVGMLLGLVLRGVAFEFRWRTRNWRWFWDLAFWWGSLQAGFLQGVVLGGLVQGIAVADRKFAGGTFDWLTPFSVLSGLGLVTGYALLGSTWLNLKLEGDLQDRMRRLARRLTFAVLAFIVVVVWRTASLEPQYLARWLNWPAVIYSCAMPFLVLAVVWRLLHGLARGRDLRPFLSAQLLFVICYVGIGVSFYPDLVPPSLSIAEAAAPDKSLRFALIGALILVPVILAYTGFSYWIFRGKVDPSKSYD